MFCKKDPTFTNDVNEAWTKAEKRLRNYHKACETVINMKEVDIGYKGKKMARKGVSAPIRGILGASVR